MDCGFNRKQINILILSFSLTKMLHSEFFCMNLKPSMTF
jgi:hypothetical protein